MGWAGMDWIDLLHDKNQWRAPVNTVRNISSSVLKHIRQQTRQIESSNVCVMISSLKLRYN